MRRSGSSTKRDRRFRMRAAIVIHDIRPHSGKEKVKVWRAGRKYTNKEGIVKQARKWIKSDVATHELHFNGKDIKEAEQNTELPDSDVGVIYWRYGEWRFIHGEDEYHIITWGDLIPGEGGAPVARRHQGRMFYLLVKLDTK